MKRFLFIIITILLIFSSLSAQQSIYEPADLDTVKYSFDDFGTMWTFDDIPFDRFREKYNFEPNEEWLDDIQKSALQFGGGCSAAFVSEDGLIMTNHHCGRGMLPRIQKEGEDLLLNGFYASTLEEERNVPGTFVDQLIEIYEVTDRIKEVMSSGISDDEKIKLKREEIQKIETEYGDETGLICKVVTLYHGGKYSLYCYKRYSDIRLVMAPDFQIAATGWDWDNFTYPRYELDFAFYRAYEDDKPVKTDHYFKFSENGAVEDELIFIVGRPGGTDRMLSYAELEYLRDYTYRQRLLLYNELYKVVYDQYLNLPADRNESRALNSVMGLGNGRKSYAGRLVGLKDPIIMKKKLDFQNKLKSEVQSDPKLNEKYGSIWDDLQLLFDELSTISNELNAYGIYRRPQVQYLGMANDIVKYAEQMKLPEEKREDDYKGDALKNIAEGIFPQNFDQESSKQFLLGVVNYLNGLIPNDPVLLHITEGKKGMEAVEYLLSNSKLTSIESIHKVLEMDPDQIFQSEDPFIYFKVHTQEKLEKYRKQAQEINNTISIKNELLGEVVSSVYSDKIPPDATSTLRITDGVIKGYEYNGTIAPGKTTFFGLYDRYYSFGGDTYPWGLHERFFPIPEELDLSTAIGFASTNDIVGGNSGSSVINTKGEVVGLVHDGNMESLPGHIIFLEENNRAVATDSKGLIEALKYIYKTDRLVDELGSGKIK